MELNNTTVMTEWREDEKEEKIPVLINILDRMENMKLSLSEKPTRSFWFFAKIAYSYFNALGLIIFCDSPITGISIFLAFAWTQPVTIAATMLASVLLFGMCKVLNVPIEDFFSGVLQFNTFLLTSLATMVLPGFLGIQLTFMYWILLIGAIILTFSINIGLNNILKSTRIGGITLPFNIGIILLLLVAKASIMNASEDVITLTEIISTQNVTENIQWAKVLTATLLSSGQVFGINDLIGSILIWFGLAFYSPIACVIMYLGSFLATFTAVALSSPLYEVYDGLWGFNAVLTSGGLCFFLLQTPIAMGSSILAAIFSTAVQAGLDLLFRQAGLLVFSIPAHVALYIILTTSLHKESSFIFSENGPPQEIQLYRYYTKCKGKEPLQTYETTNTNEYRQEMHNLKPKTVNFCLDNVVY